MRIGNLLGQGGTLGNTNLSGEVDFSGEQTSTATGTNNNFAVTDNVSVLRWSGASSITISGLTGGAAGRVLVIVNESTSQSIFLASEGAASTAANRLSLLGNTTLTIGSLGAAVLRYDAANQRWRCLGAYTSSLPTLQVAGNSVFSSNVDMNGAWRVAPATGEQADTSTGTNNDFAINTGVTTLRWNGAGAGTITGFTNGSNGRMLLVINEAPGQALTLTHEAAGSTAANRMTLLGSVSLTIDAQGGALFRYDATSSRWRNVCAWTRTLGTITTSALTVSGSLVATSVVTISGATSGSALSGTTNDWSPTSNPRQRISASAAATITGFATGVASGRITWFENVSSFNVTLSHEGSGSTAANRFVCPSSVDVVMPPGAVAFLHYDNTLSRWSVMPGIGCWQQASNTSWGHDEMSLPYLAGKVYRVPAATGLSTSATLGNNSLRVVPIYIPNTITVTKMGAEVTSAGDAGSTIRLGIYAADVNGLPTTLIVDAGTIPGDAVAVAETATISATIGPGLYWMAACIQGAPGTQPTVRILSGFTAMQGIPYGATPLAGQIVIGFSQPSVTGALPNPFTGSSGISGMMSVHIKT